MARRYLKVKERWKKYEIVSSKGDIVKYLVANSQFKGYKDIVRVSRMLNDYFNLMFNAIRAGHPFEIPGFMKVSIIKKEMTHPKVWRNGLILKKQKYVSNPHRPYNYSFLIEAEILQHYKFRFVVAAIHRNKLYKDLTITNIDFPMMISK